ncbi:PA0069 family radical SAM protein [Cytophagaceae bacterium ABcell3]|nr:PA0069 family radical SAM protein [Cytophagaceae bacterium ABcell3]
MHEHKKNIKGRAAGYNSPNKFSSKNYAFDHIEGIDEPFYSNENTQYLTETPATIVHKVNSPDVGLAYSLNAYQGCEHGCIYCYARNSHEYWGYSAGLDFERKIIVKKNAPELLEAFLNKPKWTATPITISGNTDCYQPAERKFELTRKILEVFLKYKHPVAIITKNSLILRDLDLLAELNKLDLVHVNVSITTLEEKVRQKLEPRTSTATNRLKTVEALSNVGIPVNVMTAPIVPGLTDHEIPALIKAASEAGAVSASYIITRLNGTLDQLFKEWIHREFPEKADKVLNQIAACHNGKLNDSRFGIRMSGEGKVAEAIRDLFRLSCKKYLNNKTLKPLNLSLFTPRNGSQLSMF